MHQQPKSGTHHASPEPREVSVGGLKEMGESRSEDERRSECYLVLGRATAPELREGIIKKHNASPFFHIEFSGFY